MMEMNLLNVLKKFLIFWQKYVIYRFGSEVWGIIFLLYYIIFTDFVAWIVCSWCLTLGVNGIRLNTYYIKKEFCYAC